MKPDYIIIDEVEDVLTKEQLRKALGIKIVPMDLDPDEIIPGQMTDEEIQAVYSPPKNYTGTGISTKESLAIMYEILSKDERIVP